MRRTLQYMMVCFLFAAANIWGTTKQGGRGLFYLDAARTLPKGYLEFYTGIRYFGKIASFGANEGAYTLWNVQGFAALNYGISPHVELTLSPILYQDTNGKGGNILRGSANFPDDLFISLKIGSFGALESPFLFGGHLYTRIPTGRRHNIIYEPYSAGTIEVGVNGLVSYYSNIVFPDEGWSVHGNIGYLNHNDVGENLTANMGMDTLDIDNPVPQTMSSEMLIGLGFYYPAGGFDFSVELNSRFFLARPPETAYSREFVSYLTGGVYYKPYRWLTIEMGFDVRLFSGENLTEYFPATKLPSPPNAAFPNYPSWRGILGLKFAILPTSVFSSPEENMLKQKDVDRQEILDRIMKGQKDTKGAEDELTRIRSEREKLEAEMKRLRQLLEEESKKKKKKEGEEGTM
jgi:hypothetical protein